MTFAGITSTESWDLTTSTPAILSDGANDYIYGPNGEVVEQLNTSTNSALYLVQDQLGSTRLALDSSGNVKEAVTYDPWGNPTINSGAVSSPIGYAGGYTDPATGFIYLINRYYDPTTAQFVSVDPDFAETNEAYIYVGDDPVNRIDPSGLFSSLPFACTIYLEITCLPIDQKFKRG